MDLLPDNLRRLSPVGRLDKDTEGLLLLTNDGTLANRLMHPRYDTPKTYFVRVKGNLLKDEIRRLQKGVRLDDFKTAPVQITRVIEKNNETEFCITLHEGKKRQIRLMLQSVGHRVVFLKRLSQGPLLLGTLKSGKWRDLTPEEIKALKE